MGGITSLHFTIKSSSLNRSLLLLLDKLQQDALSELKSSYATIQGREQTAVKSISPSFLTHTHFQSVSLEDRVLLSE